MFHLSLPVEQFDECLAFYTTCFDARVVWLNKATANLFVFGGQLTLHDSPISDMSAAARISMHFGQVVSSHAWLELHAKIMKSDYKPIKTIMADGVAITRSKLLIRDPSGNIVEINSSTAEN